MDDSEQVLALLTAVRKTGDDRERQKWLRSISERLHRAIDEPLWNNVINYMMQDFHMESNKAVKLWFIDIVEYFAMKSFNCKQDR
jgi:hypothetical protein